MDVARPSRILTSAQDLAVLAVLAGTNRPLSGREIGRLSTTSHGGTQRALGRLTEHGLVLTQEASPAILYTLNRDHLAAPAIAILADMREELIVRLREALAGWVIQPAAGWMFGSAARGDGDTHSDIDLFLVRAADIEADDSTWRAQVDSLAELVVRWTGNPAGIREVGETELESIIEEGPPILEQLRQDAVALTGDDASVLLTKAS